MGQTITAVYDGQVLRPETPLDLEANTRYVVTVTPIDSFEQAVDAWSVLDNLTGSVDAPPDWAREHDHYLYAAPKQHDEGHE